MSPNQRVLAAANTVRTTLEQLGWEPEQVDGDTIYSVDFGPPHVPVSSAVAAIIRPSEVFAIYFNFGVVAAPERREDVASFITLANAELVVGGFVMDYDDGHVRCKVSFDFNGEPLSATLVRNAIAAGMKAVERYGEALADVVARDADPVESFQSVRE